MQKWRLRIARVHRRWAGPIWLGSLVGGALHAFAVWMGWWSLMPAVVGVALSWLLVEADAAHWARALAFGVLAWLAVSFGYFAWWAAAAPKAVATAPRSGGDTLVATAEVRDAPTFGRADGRLEVFEFMEIAERNYGWNLRDNTAFQFTDLRNTMHQAAADGVLAFDGRPDCYREPEDRKDWFRFVPIARTHFADHYPGE